MKAAVRSRLREKSADAVRFHLRGLPTRELSHIGSIPRSAGSGDRAGDEIWKYGGEGQSPPPKPPADVEAIGSMPHLCRDRRGPCNHVKQDVPLRTKDHKRA